MMIIPIRVPATAPLHTEDGVRQLSPEHPLFNDRCPACGSHLEDQPITRYGRPAISLRNQPAGSGQGAAVHIPADQTEELIAGIRDTTRQATQEH
jgi:hypothetical protein